MNTVRNAVVVLFALCVFPQFVHAADDMTDNEEKAELNDVMMNADDVQMEATAVANEMMAVSNAEVMPAAMEEKPASVGTPNGPVLDAVKAEIKNRSKTSGTLDIYDAKIDKVRTLDLMNLKETVAQDGDNQTATGDFRDTKSGDVVTIEIKITGMEGAYQVGDFNITGAQAPQAVKAEKKDYTDEEIQNFMKEYITTQSQGTGTFDLYDEKLQKMRNLEFGKLQEKLRRYGIIAIATAEFKDKTSGDGVLADINVENQNTGLSVTAVRIKNVTKAPAKE